MTQKRNRRSRRVARALTGFAMGTFTTVLLNATPAAAQVSAAVPCEALAGLTLPDTTITLAQSVIGGSFTPPNPAFATMTGLPDFCRVTGTLTPTSDSVINFEVWLPLMGWNGRYQQQGNGGFAGLIRYGYMLVPLRRNFVVANTDDGNQDLSSSGAFAVGHPQKVIDFGYRAVHLTARVAKAITQVFYAQNPLYSYFNSCSEGGREALVEAQRYPADFDGIIAGDPAQALINQQAAGVWNQQALYKDPASTIPVTKLPAIQAAALAACDTAGDGVADGVVGDARACRFDPAVLLCTSAETDSCLTAPQVRALRLIYEGPHDPQTGQRIFPGVQPSTEAYPTGNNFITQYLSSPPGNAFMEYFVFEDPSWDYRTFDFTSDLAYAYQKRVAGQLLPDVVDATNPDLSAFQARGGKLIQYHGWTDTWIQPFSVPYYESVLALTKAGLADENRHPASRAAALAQTQAFYRLFMVPGMNHCKGGPGATAFGQQSSNIAVQPDTSPLSVDPQHDVVLALQSWVEGGVAPASIIAAKYNNDTPTGGLVFTRPLCPYPQTATYSGSGPVSDAASFVCVDQHFTLNKNLGFTAQPSTDHP